VPTVCRIDAGGVDACFGQRQLLVERLMRGTDAGIAELGSGDGDHGVDDHASIVSKVSETSIRDATFDAAFETLRTVNT
jgi:hypothetical protein